MNLIKRNPDFFDTDVFDLPTRLFGDRLFREREFPLVNIRNLENEFKVELAAPGYKKEDLMVQVDDGILTVSSEQKHEETKDQDGWRRREFRYNSFERSFQLPENADPENVQANFADGVLHLTIGKKAQAAPPRTKAVAIK